MDNRRDGKKPQEKAEEDEINWDDVAAGATAVATIGLAIGGIAYGLSQLFGTTTANMSPDPPDQSPTGPRPTRIFPVSQRSYLPQDTRAIVMAVDATPKRGGGLLICHQNKTVYHYSLDWTDYLTFPSIQQPDKFETANAFIALKLFAQDIMKIQEKFKMDDEVTIKVDNSKFNRSRSIPDRPNDDALFWARVQKLMTDCNGNCKYSDKGDTEFSAADKLSRGRDINDLYPGYNHSNYDEKALNVLQWNVQEIPSKYRLRG